jgi:phosphatidylglycerol:prolipoprotein diacylglycerol transferase
MEANSAIFYFPDFDPVAIQLGPLAIRWYALSYIVGIVLGWRLCVRMIRRWPGRLSVAQFDDFVTWLVVGVIVGGRLGQALLWDPAYFLSNPIEILYVWRGGMAFHGGLLGVIIAIAVFAHVNKIPPLAISDLVAVGTPIALFLGRLANFINGELWGRPTDGSWGVIFRHVDNLPRHPSQLYEAGLEGALLFLVMLAAAAQPQWRERTGRLTGLFMAGYALARGTAEFFREPEVDLGQFGFVTWGQVLCAPMLAFGLYLILRRPTGGAVSVKT